MKTISILFIFILSVSVYSQDNLQGLPGNKIIYNQNGQSRIITEPVVFNSGIINQAPANINYSNLTDNNSTIRWSYTDPVSVGDKCRVNGTGLYEVIGWGLNNERVSLYN